MNQTIEPMPNPPQSQFVLQAEAEAASAPVLAGDPAANELLASARRNIYHWPADFGGFAARIVFSQGNRQAEGRFGAFGSRNFTVDLPADLDLKWIRFQIEEMLAHREAPSVSRMSSKTGVVMGDWDAVYGQQVIFQGDRMQSFYRIRDGKLTQIGRTYGGNAFVINIDQHMEFKGRFVAQSYTAFYRSVTDGALTKVETFFDSYAPVGEVLLPTERCWTLADESGLLSRSLRFENHMLVGSPVEGQPVSRRGGCPFSGKA